jgi:hypothetical protein
MSEILARAKMAPLHMEADVSMWMDPAKFNTFERQLEAHISHTRHLSFRGHLGPRLPRLSSPAPTLESLSLSQRHPGLSVIIPDNLFNCTTPNLTSLELKYADISWKSPLLKGLRNLQILDISAKVRPTLEDWLDSLNEMPKLETLSLQSATPLAALAGPLISEHSRTITHPSITHFHIDDSAKDCALALAHLLLPTLARLHINVKSYDEDGEDVKLLIPYVARNVYVLQDIEPIRSILIAGERTCADVYGWAMPDADVEIYGPATLGDLSRSTCLTFSAKGNMWRNGVDTAIFDALLTLLPVNFISTLTAHNRTRLSKEFWLRNASRLPSLERARLVPASVGAFMGMLAEDTPPDGPLLPSLTKLTLLHVVSTTFRTYHLGDMFIKRVEEGVPLEVLDLSTCIVADHAIQFLSEIVVDIQAPLGVPPMAMEKFFQNSKHVGIGYCDEVEYDGRPTPWYNWHGNMDDGDGTMVRDDGEGEDEGEDQYYIGVPMCKVLFNDVSSFA